MLSSRLIISYVVKESTRVMESMSETQKAFSRLHFSRIFDKEINIYLKSNISILLKVLTTAYNLNV
jgi:hypothetical protein